MTKSEVKSFFLALSFAIIPIGNVIACLEESIRLNQDVKKKLALVHIIGMVIPASLILLAVGRSFYYPWNTLDINLLDENFGIFLTITFFVVYASSIIFTLYFFTPIDLNLIGQYSYAVWAGFCMSSLLGSIFIFILPFANKSYKVEISACFKPFFIRVVIPILLIIWGTCLFTDLVMTNKGYLMFYGFFKGTFLAYVFLLSLYSYEFGLSLVSYRSVNPTTPQPTAQEIADAQNRVRSFNDISRRVGASFIRQNSTQTTRQTANKPQTTRSTPPTIQEEQIVEKASEIVQETYDKGWKNDNTTQIEIDIPSMFDILRPIRLCNEHEKRVVLLVERIYPYIIQPDKNQKAKDVSQSLKNELAEIKLECVRHIYRQAITIAVEDYNKVPNI